MTTIPLTVVDNFFPDIENLKRFALEQEYRYPKESRFPGARSKCLSELHPPLYGYIMKKVLSLFFETCNFDFKCNLSFQKIEDYNGQGWIHQDENVFTFMLYLTESDIDCGTSFWELKKGVYYPFENQEELSIFQSKREHYKTKKITKEQQLQKDFIIDKNFNQILNVKDKINRLVCFSAEHFHCANNLGDENNSTRLTLIGFVDSLGRSDLPIVRSKKTLMM